MSAITDSASEFSTVLFDGPHSPPAPRQPTEPTVAELARETWAPIGRFASDRVEIAQELAFRALFLGAAVITFYGLVSVF